MFGTVVHMSLQVCLCQDTKHVHAERWGELYGNYAWQTWQVFRSSVECCLCCESRRTLSKLSVLLPTQLHWGSQKVHNCRGIVSWASCTELRRYIMLIEISHHWHYKPDSKSNVEFVVTGGCPWVCATVENPRSLCLANWSLLPPPMYQRAHFSVHGNNWLQPIWYKYVLAETVLEESTHTRHKECDEVLQI